MTTYTLNGLDRMGKLALKPMIEGGAKIECFDDVVGSTKMQAHPLEFNTVYGHWDAVSSHDVKSSR